MIVGNISSVDANYRIEIKNKKEYEGFNN